MRRYISLSNLIIILIALCAFSGLNVHAKIRVVTTLPTYASLVEEIGGDKIEVSYIVEPNQDPHFAQPKPSYALKLRKADLFVATGLDLELWVPPVIDKSGNSKVREGQKGYVSAATGLKLLEVPETGTTRAEGDIHIFGNPHITTGPLNVIRIAGNIGIGLKRIDPSNSEYYDSQVRKFQEKMHRALFGDELVDLFGGRKLAQALESGKLDTLLDDPKLNALVGSPSLRQRLGGWIEKAQPLKKKEIMAYHRNWIYFTDIFDIKIVDYFEAKPGVPPSAKRVGRITKEIEDRKIKAFVVSSYFERKTPMKIQARTGAKAVILTLDVYGEEGADDYFALVDLWLSSLLAAFGS
ncbi:metal ABC transporter substrate-binding protein [Acidobacteriota bacterium]